MTLQGAKRKVVTVSDFRFTGRLLGKGNFARVEEAIHNILNIKVAVKIIDIKEIKEKYVIKNLYREARILSMLNHPCIAGLFQTIQLADSTYYLVTELIGGGDLCSFIIGQRFGKLEERPARIYARQFASALSHMHSYGIVHRDLKMENVMLNSTQTQIKIVDFGLSNVWTSDSPLRTHCGSPEYAAPELFIAGKEYGPEVDLWSLGIIFYGMVVGQLPFVSGRKNQLTSQERRKKLVAQINKGLGASQRQAIALLSLEFRAMLNKLLMADPEKRITVKELIVHPWITEKGRKFVQTHPFKKLDGQWQSKLTKHISELIEVDQNTTIGEICKNPYGRIGGMFNIITFKTLTDAFTVESIAPFVPKLECNDNEKSPKNAVVKPKFVQGTKSQGMTLVDKLSRPHANERPKSAIPVVVLVQNETRMTRSKTSEQKQNKTVNPPAKQGFSKVNTLIINRRNQDAQKLRTTISTHTSTKNKDEVVGTSNKRPFTTGSISSAPRPLKRNSNGNFLQAKQSRIATSSSVHEPNGNGRRKLIKKETVQRSSAKIKNKRCPSK